MYLRKTQGFTLVEFAIVLVISGLLLGGLLRSSELITGARIRELVARQDNIKAAFFGFEERFRAVPGDYSQATINIRGATQNGNGRIESTTVPNESILAWEQLTQAGFLTPHVGLQRYRIGPDHPVEFVQRIPADHL